MKDTQSLLETAALCSRTLIKKIVDIRVDRLKKGKNPDRSPKGDPLHLAHYTTADGLDGIIRDGTLWASAAYYLNDSSEIDYGCRLFVGLLEALIAKSDIHPIPKKVFEDAKTAFEPSGSMQSIVSRTYVACFCENENLLSQWRTYGQRGGYSIVFPRQSLQADFGVHKDLYHVELNKVIYAKDIQIRLLELVLSDLLEALQDEGIKNLYQGFEPEEKKLFITSFNTTLQTMAINEIVRFKHPAFDEEKEWRIIARPTSIGLQDEEIHELKFRTSRGMMVPFVELHPQKGALLPIAWVRYGPTLEKKRVINSLELLFRQKGYSGMKFAGSEIPVIMP